MTTSNDNPHTPNLEWHRSIFHKAGWFIPPYLARGFIGKTAKWIESNPEKLSNSALTELLQTIYSEDRLAAMLMEHYKSTPRINEYISIIHQSIQAHFFGMPHIAISGLLPVIEGAGKKITEDRLPGRSIGKHWFRQLTEDCVRYVNETGIGMPGEYVSMLLSFRDYAKDNLYADPERYLGIDGTNRHGIVHGTYIDTQYGNALNFYKCISAIDFLCIASRFKYPTSLFAASPTEESMKLADFFTGCSLLSRTSPWSSRNIEFKHDSTRNKSQRG